MSLARIRALFYAIWFIFTVVCVVIAMAVKNSSHRCFRRIWGRFQRYGIGYDIEIIGTPDPRAQLVIANHQSIMDIVVLEETHPADICWIAKKEIADIPIIGKIITLPKMIQVDRSNPRDLVRIVHEVQQRVSEGRVITMFPEGTRHRGTQLLQFQSGAKAIVSKLGLRVQPVVLIGTQHIANSHDFTVHSGHIKIIYLDLLDTSDKDWLQHAREAMQAVIDENETTEA